MISSPKDLQQARAQSKKLSSDELKRLEKVELHRHLEGSLRFSTLLELAPQVGLEIPDNTLAQTRKFLVTEPMKDLVSVLDKFWMTQSVLSSQEILTRIAFEAVEDAYLEGIRILELRYSPTFIRKNHESLSFEQIHQSLMRGLELAKKYPIAVGLICILQRTLSLEINDQVCSFAIDHKESFIALDLADDEDARPARDYEKIFLRARKAGLAITVHAGESTSATAPQNIVDAVQFLGAERIGHGVQILKSPEALKLIMAKKIPLELCPTSNWLTSAVPSIPAHPFQVLMEQGVRTTINSDDPGIFGITLTHEYELLARHFHLTRFDFETCNDFAANASFIKLSEKQKFWPRPILKI